MGLSQYQLNICNHFAIQAGNLAVVAVAGSGKTYTAVKAMGHIPRNANVLLGSFNTDIAIEFGQRLKDEGINHVKPRTYNSFGWGICLRNMTRKPELDRDKTSNILEFVVLRNNRQHLQQWKHPITRLVSLFKSLNLHEIEEIDFWGIVDHYGLEVPEHKDFEAVTIQTFLACNAHMEHFDFDDQKYMPIHYGWPVPCFDQVILDEFQDTCPIEMELMGRAAKGGQIAGFGDPDQSIYGFKGATPDNFEQFVKNYNAKELPLSICYRCPIAVIEEAKKIVPRIEAALGAVEGSVEDVATPVFHDQVQSGDFVLCRTTEPLVKRCLRGIREGRPGKIRGRDFGGVIAYLIDKVSEGRDTMYTDSFITRLIEHQFERIEQLKAQRREAEILRFEDRCNTIRALADRANTVSDIKANGKKIFSDEAHGGIDYMTIHKSKGLQKANVWLLRPDLLPHPNAKKDWMVKEEKRLKYVAQTRSTLNLRYVLKEKGER